MHRTRWESDVCLDELGFDGRAWEGWAREGEAKGSVNARKEGERANKET